MNNIIKEKLALLPLVPGVYIMKNSSGQIIYIGKAKKLKNRVTSYFRKNSSHTSKVLSMVSNIYDFDYFVTASEKDALALECNLIKKHQPYYNILLKDGKTYPYVKVELSREFPIVSVTHKVEKDGSKYFGPFMAGVGAYEVLNVINEAFPIRKCKSEKFTRACIDYEMGNCLAPCINKVTKEEYDKLIDEVCDFLNGNTKNALTILTRQMEKAKEEMNYEVALRKRDAIKVIHSLKEKVVVEMARNLDCDFFAYASDGLLSGVAVGIVRNGKLIGVSSHSTVCDEEALEDFILQYYDNELIPSEVVINCKLESVEPLEEYLSSKRGGSVKITLPVKGDKKTILDTIKTNALQQIIKASDRRTIKYNRTVGAVKFLKEELDLKNLPNRIECYDISHISGEYKVASMVVMEEGECKKKDYRKFKIKTVEGNNDFACMREVITRRLAELDKASDSSFSKKPDLVIIDGGKGQLSSVIDLFDNRDIEVVSLAKRLEEVFKWGLENSILLDHNHSSLKLIQKIRDEAHRFAITFHRSIRSKGMEESVLDGIKGVGKMKKLALFRHFKSYEKMAKASIDELMSVSGITLENAKAIKEKLTNN